MCIPWLMQILYYCGLILWSFWPLWLLMCITETFWLSPCPRTVIHWKNCSIYLMHVTTVCACIRAVTAAIKIYLNWFDLFYEWPCLIYRDYVVIKFRFSTYMASSSMAMPDCKIMIPCNIKQERQLFIYLHINTDIYVYHVYLYIMRVWQ